MGKALVLVGYTRCSADHTHPAQQQRYILPEYVAAAAADSVEVGAEAEVEAGAGLETEERQNDGQIKPGSESAVGFALGPFQVVLG